MGALGRGVPVAVSSDSDPPMLSASFLVLLLHSVTAGGLRDPWRL